MVYYVPPDETTVASPSLSSGGMFQESQWMSKTTDNTKPHTYMYIYMLCSFPLYIYDK